MNEDLLYKDYQGDHKFTITTYSSTGVHVTACDCFYRGNIGKEVDTLMILTSGSRLEGESLAMCIFLGKRGLVYHTFIQSELQCLSFNVFGFRNLSANNVCIISC
ncbi:hypothetical protein HanPI659440_Chr05g0200291 [Helianthus annuus]|nr:hypothetical protein HanPI659440_Chr05g0200291 [Helianthus annuus]